MNKKSIAPLVGVYIITTFFIWPTIFLSTTIRAGAATYIEVAERLCPNGAKISSFSHQADEATALLDDNRYALNRDLARELYRCSVATSNPYVHDIAVLLYESSLLSSLKTNGEMDESGPLIAVRLNDLAAATRFADIREHALSLKQTVLDTSASAHQAIYGTPTPEPTPEDLPT